MRELNQGGKIDLILTEAEEIRRHIHGRELWFGISGDQSGNDWALSGTLNPFVLTSGVGDWGAWGKIVGPDDTPIFTGRLDFSIDRLLISEVEVLTPYLMQIVWGGTDGDDSLSLGNVSEFMYISSTDNPSKAGGGPGVFRMSQVVNGTKVWARIKCASASTMDLFIGFHGHD